MYIDLKLADTSVYTCIAISESGETAWSAGLTVELPSNPSVVFHRTPDPSTFPGAPSKLTISDVTDSSLRLSWRPSENNGASPVHSYTVEFFTQHSDKVGVASFLVSVASLFCYIVVFPVLVFTSFRVACLYLYVLIQLIFYLKSVSRCCHVMWSRGFSN